MKKGLNIEIPIRIGMDIPLIERIEFHMEQRSVKRLIEYPSDIVKVIDNRLMIIDLSREFLADFKPGQVRIDTRITLKDSWAQPVTKIVNAHLRPTLFEDEENEERRPM